MRSFLALATVFAFSGSAFAQVAFDTFDADSGLLNFTQTPAPGAFSSPGDGFEEFQRNVSPSIPFSLLDDSAVTFPGDTLGIVDDFKLDAWFGVTDIVNSDNPSGTGTASWTFDVSGASNLGVSIDMGAMGDFEASDVFDWTWSIDGSTPAALFTSSVDENGSQNYTLADGSVQTLDDPLLINGTLVNNNFQTFSAAVAGTGNQLTITLNAATDGGSEGYAFDNITITPEPTSLILLALGGLGLIRRR